MSPLIFLGRIEKGEGIATALGCPTVNVAIEENTLIPGLGVYAAISKFEGYDYPSLVYVNYGKTGKVLKIEVHFLDQSIESAVDKMIEVNLLEKIRDIVTWENDEQIKKLILQDLENAKKWFIEYQKE